MRFKMKRVKGEMKFFVDGQEVTEKEFDKAMDQQKPSVSSENGTVKRPRSMKRGYPIKSVALAVHSRQVAKMREDSVKKGVPTDYTTGGRPILRDAAHRKAYLKLYGFHDRNSYNGY